MGEEVILSYVIPTVFLLCGVGLLIGGLVTGAKTRAFLCKASETQGEIVALEEEPPMEKASALYWMRPNPRVAKLEKRNVMAKTPMTS